MSGVTFYTTPSPGINKLSGFSRGEQVSQCGFGAQCVMHWHAVGATLVCPFPPHFIWLTLISADSWERGRQIITHTL